MSTCRNCWRELTVNEEVYTNLDTYGGPNTLAVTKCCGVGVTVTRNVTYTIKAYKGNRTEDDWGRNINKSRNQRT